MTAKCVIKDNQILGRLLWCRMITENELLAELFKELHVPEIAEGEITASMLSASLNIGERAALYKLQKLEKQGKLTSRWVRLSSNGRGWAFKKIELPEK